MYGRKRVFLAGLGGFAVASAIGGMAGNIEVLIAARALQGAFGALSPPRPLSLLTTTFVDPAERAKAFGIYGAIAGGGGAVGPAARRRAHRVPVVALVPLREPDLRRDRDPAAARLLIDAPTGANRKLDLPGVTTSVLGLFLVVFGLAKAETEGWESAATIVPLVAGVLVLAVFVALQRRTHDPLLPLSVVTDRLRGGAFLAVGIAPARACSRCSCSSPTSCSRTSR